MSLEENKVIARRLTDEGVNKLDLDALDEIVDPDYILHGAPPELASGLEGLKQLMTGMDPAFPGWHATIEDMIAEGDKVAVRWSAVGTHKGEWEGIPPTGRQAAWTGILIYRIAGGKIVEEWVIDNSQSIMLELAAASAQTTTKK